MMVSYKSLLEACDSSLFLKKKSHLCIVNVAYSVNKIQVPTCVVFKDIQTYAHVGLYIKENLLIKKCLGFFTCM